MNRSIYILIFILIISCISTRDINAEKMEVTWLVADFPPYSIVSGPFKGMGGFGFMRGKIEGEMKEYHHETMVANSKRIFHELKYQDKVIYGTAAKTKERKKFVIYSVPYVVIIPNNLITLEKKINKLKPYLESDEFDLETALKEKKVYMGYSVARAYGKMIDRVLKENRGSKKLKVNFRNFFRDSFLDLLNGNVDCIIGYPNEASYFLKLLKRNESVVTFSFKGEQKYVIGYFVLPKTEWGKKTMALVNRILTDNRNTEEFHRTYERWIDKKSRILYRKLTRDLYNK